MRPWLWILALPTAGVAVAMSEYSGPTRTVLIAVSIFVILKLESLAEFESASGTVSVWDKVLWIFAWPGLDPSGFFFKGKQVQPPSAVSWVGAVLQTLFGGLMFFVAAPLISWYSEIAGGWTAMIGIIFLLHFGSLRMVALAWRGLGRDVSPIMDSPICATSLSEFWGRRWNIAFRDFAHASVFRPIAKRWNTTLATWASFVFSGFVHELAISVPAGAGYGFPLCYFLLQGAGVSLERRLAKQGLRIRGGLVGWLYTAVFTLPAALFLFHRPFVHNVIQPLIPRY